MTAVTQLLPPGTRVADRYTIVRKLGAGGFATVFEATDEMMDRGVALKVLHALGMADDATREAFVKRFEREAKLAAKIHHPGVLNVFDYGILPEHELPYIVMELLDGEDLGDFLKREGAMPASRIIPLFIPALEALGYAHAEGIVHRDLKPSNLFLKHPGERREALCVVDFGIAHLQDLSTRLTQTGSVMGTPAYVAPEYATEQLVSPALDVYQMGLILVEALSAQAVVQAPDSLVAMFQHVYGNIAIPQPLLDSPLGPVLQKALAWDPRARYADGFAFADALKALDPATIPLTPAGAPTIPLQDHPSRELSGVPPVTPPAGVPGAPARRREVPPTVLHETPTPARSNATLIGAGALVLMAVLGAGALANHLMRQDHAPTPNAPQTTLQAALTTPTPPRTNTTTAPPDTPDTSATNNTAGQTTDTSATHTDGNTDGNTANNTDGSTAAQTTTPAPPKPTPPKPKPKPPKPKPPKRPFPWDRSTRGIFEAIAQHRSKLEACVHGKPMVIEIMVQLDEDGAVTLAHIPSGGDNINDRRCVAREVKQVTFAPSDRKTGHNIQMALNGYTRPDPKPPSPNVTDGAQEARQRALEAHIQRLARPLNTCARESHTFDAVLEVNAQGRVTRVSIPRPPNARVAQCAQRVLRAARAPAHLRASTHTVQVRTVATGSPSPGLDDPLHQKLPGAITTQSANRQIMTQAQPMIEACVKAPTRADVTFYVDPRGATTSVQQRSAKALDPKTWACIESKLRTLRFHALGTSLILHKTYRLRGQR